LYCITHPSPSGRQNNIRLPLPLALSLPFVSAHSISMGSQTTHSLVFCISVVAVLMLQCLLMGSSVAPDHDNYHLIPVENFKWKDPQGFAKCPASSAGQEALKPGVKIRLDHIHGACSPLRPINSSSWIDLVSQSFERDNARLNTIRSKNSGPYTTMSNLPLQSGTTVGTGNYIVTAGFGTPAKNSLLIIDTGSDLTWIQCKPCADCYSQVDAIFEPKQSSSYKTLPCLSATCTELITSESNPTPCLLGGCVYEINYGDGSSSQGDFSQETLTLGSDSFQNFAFGCGHTNTGLFKGSSGLLGLGQNSLSFPSQSKSKYGGQFAYCLPDFGSSTSTGSFSVGKGSIPASAVFTPLVSNFMYPTFYFVGLNGISVGGDRLSIPPAVLGRGSTIVDSGTVITRLLPQAYNALKTSFRSKTRDLPSAKPFSILDTCYDLSRHSQVRIPTITFHFQNNADVAVSDVGILVPVQNDGSQVCLAFASASQMDGFNIIGNFQQQRMRVAFDTGAGRIGFASGSCAA